MEEKTCGFKVALERWVVLGDSFALHEDKWTSLLGLDLLLVYFLNFFIRVYSRDDMLSFVLEL